MKKGSKYTPEQLERKRKEMRDNPPHLGVKHSLEARKNISLSLKGENHPMWGKKFSLVRRKRISGALKGRKFSLETRLKMSLAKKGLYLGNKHPNWQGGITPINQKIKNSIEYKLWRLSVFERDKFTCVLCGAKGVYLNADHIKPFSLFPKLRFNINNGRTLCVPCHEKTDTFKGRIRHYKNESDI